MNEPRLFSKSAILAFSILLSTLFGAVLLAQNLNEVGKKNKIIHAILLAIIWNITVLRFCSNIFINPLISYLLVNALGGLILIFPFWNQYLKEIINYEKSPIWGPLIVFVVLVGGFAAYAYFR